MMDPWSLIYDLDGQTRTILRQEEYDEICDDVFLSDGSNSELHILVEDDDDSNVPASPLSPRTANEVATVSSSQRGALAFSAVLKPRHSHLKMLENRKDISQHFQEHSASLRVMHIRQKNSHAPLRVTRDVFDHLLEEASIFSPVRDAVLYMGRRSLEVEVAPPRPRSRLLRSNRSQAIDGYEMVYGLRFFQRNQKTDDQNPWSLRQCVIYNKFTTELKSLTWLFVSLPDVAQEVFNTYVDNQGQATATRPFDIHLLLIGVTTNLWRPYLIHLATRIDEHTRRLMLASPTGKGPLNLTDDDGGERQRQQLKEIEDEITDGLLCLDSTEDTLRSFLNLATKLKSNNLAEYTKVIDAFEEKLREVEMLRKKLKALRDKLASTTQVVSTFLDLGNGYALKTLAERAHEESEKMARLGQKANKDAAAVKALTVITLIYLPITVVLNFFSASFIDTSAGDMRLVGKWWLFIIISVPLTAITIYGWRIWLRFHDDDIPTRWTSILRRKPRSIRSKLSQQGLTDPEKGMGINVASLGNMQNS